ncbi:hypothetical protein INT43_007283 [Umbelopsis isabellina]|uniref:Ubiquitin thioesterase OTU n=1 Tax=Mortierella isabellina TaxID=91625 RepID=A0A8H7PYX9_MORIS|nr:hypothetical protein INT43_007283 [Umbelopsis isabellina]
MRLRFRHPEGIATLSNVDESANMATLKRQIAEEIDLPTGKVIKVSGGYPPKPYNDEALSLSELGLKNGDAVIVTIADEPSHNMESQGQANANTDTKTKEPSKPSQSIAPPSIVSNNGDEAVEVDGSYLVIREMEDDNSCLFRAVGYALSKDVGRAQELRETVAAAIQSDPINYPEAILGQPVERYVNWIMKPTSWGGAIELSIFSRYFNIEIDSFDVATGRVDKFGKGFREH